MPRNNLKLMLSLAMAIGCLITAESFGQANPGGLVNNTNRKWVARRNGADKNDNQHVAVVLHITEAQGTRTATLWTYSSLDANNVYQGQRKFINLAQVKFEVKPGSSRRNRETAVFAETFGEERVTVYATMYRNRVPGNGHGPRNAQRVILRYTIKPINPGARAKMLLDDCEEEPNEDVLEEENVDPDGQDLGFESEP